MALKRGARPIPRMPFGRFRGFAIRDLSDDYLSWLFKWPELRDPLREDVYNELVKRDLLEEGEDRGLNLSTLVEQARRRLALKYHPDRRGDAGVMTGINVMADYLLGEIENETAQKSA